MKLLFRIISIAYLIILSIAFLIPLDFFIVTQVIEKEQHPGNNTSFLIHLGFFFILYLFFYLSFSNKKKNLIFCLTYGFIIEFLQIFTTRGFQIGDIIFNILGVLICYLLIIYFFEK